MKSIATTFFLGFCLLPSLALSAHAQMEIRFPEVLFYMQHKPSVTTSFTCQNPAMLGSTLHAGDTNVAWDFTVANYKMDPPHASGDSAMPPTGIPLADDSNFATCDAVIRTTLSPTSFRYQMFLMHPDIAFNQGIIEVTGGVARKIIGWSPPIEEATYPMTYRTAWQSTSVVDGDTLQPGEHRVIATKSIVDGWGNLVLPIPSAYSQEALRVKEQRIETVSRDGIGIHSDTTIIYHYYTSGFISATIVTNAGGTIQSATYTENFDSTASVIEGSTANRLGLSISENPASTSITKVFYTLKNTAPTRVELMDVLGRSVRMLQNGTVTQGRHIIEIDPTTLPSGSYFVRVQAEGKSSMQKLVIAR